jgi:hypothetical protein
MCYLVRFDAIWLILVTIQDQLLFHTYLSSSALKLNNRRSLQQADAQSGAAVSRVLLQLAMALC